MIWGAADEAHSLSYVTNWQNTKQPGETHRCKGYFYTAPKFIGKGNYHEKNRHSNSAAATVRRGSDLKHVKVQTG